MKFSKQLVAALFAAVLVAGLAQADFIRILEAKRITTDELFLGETQVTAGGGDLTFAGTLSAADVDISDDLVVDDDALVSGTLSVTEDVVVTDDLTADDIKAATNVRGGVAATQVIGAGGTIAADSCGGVKRVSSAAAVTTDTTNTFTAPAAANAGCVLHVCNENAADAITLDFNANFQSAAAGNVVLGALDCVSVASSGASGKWYQISALQDN